MRASLPLLAAWVSSSITLSDGLHVSPFIAKRQIGNPLSKVLRRQFLHGTAINLVSSSHDGVYEQHTEDLNIFGKDVAYVIKNLRAGPDPTVKGEAVLDNHL